jgi:hypothetical protein
MGDGQKFLSCSIEWFSLDIFLRHRQCWILYSTASVFRNTNYVVFLQDNYNALHIAAMYSREDTVKIMLAKKGVDPFASGGVSSW